MADSKKIKYLSKTVNFGGKTLTLFSVDGTTWSSRKQELLEIKERQERDKVSFAAIKEENGETRVIPKVKGKTPVPAAAYDDEEEVVAAVEDDELFPKVDYSTDEEAAPRKRGRKPQVVQVKAEAAKPEKAKKSERFLSIAKKPAAKEKKAMKVSPKKRVSGKPKLKSLKGRNKGKRKAA